MQKRITTTLFLIVLTLTLTQLATAQWIDNEFTNQLNEDVFVAFTTFRPAVGNIPEGWRTVGWYPIRAGASHTFQAWDDNPIYYLVWEEGYESYISPHNAQEYRHWESLEAFVTVDEMGPETIGSVTEGTLIYKSPTDVRLKGNSNFFRTENGSSVFLFNNVSEDGVYNPSVRVVSPSGEGPGPRPRGDDMDDTPRPSSLAVDGDMSISTGETGTITATVRSAGGEALSEVTVRFSENSDHISLSRTSGTTDNFGKVSTTVTAISQGGSVLSVAVDGYPALTKHEAITVGETPPGSLTINNFSASINEGDSRTITATLKSKSGNPISGKNIRFQESSNAISFSATSGTTNDSGQVSTTLRTSHVSSRRQSATFYVRVDGYSGLDKSVSVTVNQVANSLLINTSLPPKMNSGNSNTVRVTVRSKDGSPMSGVRVEFSENSSYLRFSSTSVNTNNAGQAWSTLRTGGHGGDSKLYITVTVPGTSLRDTDWTRVQGTEKSFTRTASFKSKKDCNNNNINGQYDWSRTVTVPGRIIGKVSYTWSIPNDDKCCVKVSGGQFTLNNTGFQVYGLSFPHCTNPNTVDITVTGRYLETASLPAPSLQPQLRPEIDQLSSVWQDLSQVPSETALLPNYPNPFNPETWIPYHLAESADVTLDIYSADGKLVRTLALGHQSAGIYESKSRAAYWDGRNTIGERVASGVYFYMLTADDFTATGKMLILK